VGVASVGVGAGFTAAGFAATAADVAATTVFVGVDETAGVGELRTVDLLGVEEVVTAGAGFVCSCCASLFVMRGALPCSWCFFLIASNSFLIDSTSCFIESTSLMALSVLTIASISYRKAAISEAIFCADGNNIH